MINIEDMEVTTNTDVTGGVTVRITHKPTGISSIVSHPYSYYKARKTALEELRRKLDDARRAV